jgi:hypothetical protein
MRKINKRKRSYNVPNLNLPETSGIYLITNIRTGLKCVGSSENVLHRAIMYYNPSGPDLKRLTFHDFYVEDLEITLLEDTNGILREERYIRELAWIKKLDTIYPNGLNTFCPVTRQVLIMKENYIKLYGNKTRRQQKEGGQEACH